MCLCGRAKRARQKKQPLGREGSGQIELLAPRHSMEDGQGQGHGPVSRWEASKRERLANF